MRVLSDELKAQLQSGATTLCHCWVIERADGVSLGFTDHDKDLEVAGVVCRAGTGLDAGALQSGTGLAVDNARAAGVLTDAGIKAAHLRAGLYDRAPVTHYLVNWQDPTDHLVLFAGYLGEVRQDGKRFETELRGLSEDLNRTVGRSYLPRCDRRLGDRVCGFDVSTPGYRLEGTVESVTDNRILRVRGAGAFAERWFENGALTFTSGANAGARIEVKFDTPDGTYRVIELSQEAALPITIGDAFEVLAGCDKRAITCREKFTNFMNFRGFPHLPGEDWLAAYPAPGEVHDGTRRDG